MKLDELNKQQKEAVLITEDPLLVIAGAGSGKTKVLSFKIAYLIKEKKVSTNAILAITFTNKAAKEMKERVYNLLNKEALNIQISTFHSFGLTIIRKYYKEVGLSKNFNILDNNDTVALLKKIISDLNLDSNLYSPQNISKIISSNKNEMINATKYKDFVYNDYHKNVARIYKKYEEQLKIGNLVDFDDLLLLPIILFTTNLDILKQYQEQYKYILIDEYQDTNEIQYKLIKMISRKYKNICVVGDESQSIYSFRGANYRNILNFEKDYKNSQVILLEQNYRSTKVILDAANCVIKNNINKMDKKLWTDNEEGEKIIVYNAFHEREEAQFVALKIQSLIAKGIPLNKIAVLYRVNAQSRVIEEEMLGYNIPYKIIGNVSFYSRKEIKDLIAYLKLLYNPYDDVSLLRVINTPRRGIGNVTIQKLRGQAETTNKPLYEVINNGKELEFKNMLEELRKLVDKVSLTDLIEEILVKTKMKETLKVSDEEEFTTRLENLLEFKTLIIEFERKYGIIKLEELLYEISLVSDQTEYKEEQLVSLMTIHSAKGLEFDYVFIIGVEEGLMPHFASNNNNEEIEEERRLFYVAITRTRKKLWLIYVKKRIIFGETRRCFISRFILEINNQLIKIER